jgi:hypothetical protein
LSLLSSFPPAGSDDADSGNGVDVVVVVVDDDGSDGHARRPVSVSANSHLIALPSAATVSVLLVL